MNLSRLAALIETVAEQDGVTGATVSVSLHAVSQHDAERIAHGLAEALGGKSVEVPLRDYPHYRVESLDTGGVYVHYDAAVPTALDAVDELRRFHEGVTA